MRSGECAGFPRLIEGRGCPRAAARTGTGVIYRGKTPTYVLFEICVNLKVDKLFPCLLCLGLHRETVRGAIKGERELNGLLLDYRPSPPFSVISHVLPPSFLRVSLLCSAASALLISENKVLGRDPSFWPISSGRSPSPSSSSSATMAEVDFLLFSPSLPPILLSDHYLMVFLPSRRASDMIK